jgi:hypothetical protein
MSNQFPDLKNEIDKIKVPVDQLDDIIAMTVHGTTAKKPFRRKVLYTIGTAAAGFALFIGSAMVSPSMAKMASGIPLVGTFFNHIGDEGLRIAGQKGLTQVIGQSAKDSGITLTVNEVFYDGTRLTIGYTQESLVPLGELERPNIEVDGKEINFSSGYTGKFATPQKYVGYMDINPTEELPEEFALKMRIDAIGLIPGKWEFSFPVKQSNQVTVIKPKETKTFDGTEMKINSLKLGPAGTDLSVKVVSDTESGGIDPYQLNFYVVDDQGNVLDMVSGSGSGERVDGKEVADIEFLYSPLKENVERVRVIPYTPSMIENTGDEISVNLDQLSLPFTLDQGEAGEILIKSIEYKGKKSIVEFEVVSDAIIDNQASRNPIWMEDGNGKNLMSNDKPMAERIDGNTFRQEFVTGEKKGLKLKTYQMAKPVFYEEFVVELK